MEGEAQLAGGGGGARAQVPGPAGPLAGASALDGGGAVRRVARLPQYIVAFRKLGATRSCVHAQSSPVVFLADA